MKKSEKELSTRSVLFAEKMTRDDLEKVRVVLDQLEPEVEPVDVIRKELRDMVQKLVRKAVSREQINAALAPFKYSVSALLYTQIGRENPGGGAVKPEPRPRRKPVAAEPPSIDAGFEPKERRRQGRRTGFGTSDRRIGACN